MSTSGPDPLVRTRSTMKPWLTQEQLHEALRQGLDPKALQSCVSGGAGQLFAFEGETVSIDWLQQHKVTFANMLKLAKNGVVNKRLLCKALGTLSAELGVKLDIAKEGYCLKLGLMEIKTRKARVTTGTQQPIWLQSLLSMVEESAMSEVMEKTKGPLSGAEPGAKARKLLKRHSSCPSSASAAEQVVEIPSSSEGSSSDLANTGQVRPPKLGSGTDSSCNTGYKQYHDYGQGCLVRAWPDGRVLEASMEAGSEGFLMATFPGEDPVTTEFPVLGAKKDGSVLKKPASSRVILAARSFGKAPLGCSKCRYSSNGCKQCKKRALKAAAKSAEEKA